MDGLFFACSQLRRESSAIVHLLRVLIIDLILALSVLYSSVLVLDL